jgi:hypothetical protein
MTALCAERVADRPRLVNPLRGFPSLCSVTSRARSAVPQLRGRSEFIARSPSSESNGADVGKGRRVRLSASEG